MSQHLTEHDELVSDVLPNTTNWFLTWLPAS